MPATFTTQDRAALARRLREKGIPGSQEFVQEWVSFNTCYNDISGPTERDRLMGAIRKYLPAAEAGVALQKLSDPIQYFSRLPPGDMRKGPHNPLFRSRSTDDLNIVNDPLADPVERLAHLMSVVYQIRCNLIHGDKDPDVARDRELVRESKRVIEEVLPRLIAEME
jgi:hypothetical protein